MVKSVLEVLPAVVIMLFYGWGGLRLLNIKTFDPLGASTYPLFLAAASLVLSVYVALQPRSAERSIDWQKAKAPLFKISLITAETVVYLFLLNWAGFLLLTPVYIISMLITLGYNRYITMVLTSIFLTAVLYSTFGLLFRVLLPMGLLSRFVF